MITVTKETAILLKEAGREKETVFVYRGDSLEMFQLYGGHYTNDDLRCPTVEEIIEELPEKIINNYELTIYKRDGTYNVIYKFPGFNGNNITEALAKMRLRCKEEGHLVI